MVPTLWMDVQVLWVRGERLAEWLLVVEIEMPTRAQNCAVKCATQRLTPTVAATHAKLVLVATTAEKKQRP